MVKATRLIACCGVIDDVVDWSPSGVFTGYTVNNRLVIRGVYSVVDV